MVGCGLRPEEAFALTWDDITAHEFGGQTYARIRVDKALTVPSSGKELKSTKNTSSERDAICGEPFASRLLALKKDENVPLVPSGKPYSAKRPEQWYTSPVTVAHNWKAYCEKHDIVHVTLENMRSSYATMMGEAMAPDSVVAGNMGHSGNTVKTRHYQRVTLRAKCVAADLLSELIESVK
jgi:integrase